MSYVVILDNNRFYTEGLRFSLLLRHPEALVESMEIRWNKSLVECKILVIRCRLSITENHNSLINILSNLDAAHWQGPLHLLCNERSWALATYLRKRFEMLEIYIIDDRIAVRDVSYVLAKESRFTRSLNNCLKEIEFKVLDLLIRGIPVRDIVILLNMSEKQVSTHKCNALKKLNVNNMLRLLI